uniref:PGG domain-containing protein n=1 Tax=Oryza punctata TaxID=4537 RepID=A0A0E0KMQ7_ORYPU
MPLRVRANRKEGEELRGWLMLLATLTASITYAAALNPPGGVWQADDAANDFVAGYPVLLDKSPWRYYVFYYCNATSFASSVCIIALLAITKFYLSNTKIMVFNVLVALDMVSLGAAFVAGSSSSKRFTAFNAALMVCLVVLFLLWKRKWLMGRAAANPDPTSNCETRHTDILLKKRKLCRVYYVFYYCNGTSFVSCVCIIVLLATKSYLSDTKIMVFNVLFALNMCSLGGGFVTCSSSNKRFTPFNVALMVCLVLVFLLLKQKWQMGGAAANPGLNPSNGETLHT